MVRPLRAAALLLALALVVTLTGLGPTSAAYAHTELVHWELVGGTPDKPQELLVRFSEPIDGRFLTVDIIGPSGESQAAVTIDQQHKTDGLVDISGLAPGAYSVAWWTRALDGDPSNGSFIMGIGTAVDPIALLPPVGARDPATQPAMFYIDTVWDAIVHWLIYLGAGLMVGGLGFAVVIWSPALRKRLVQSPTSPDETPTPSAPSTLRATDVLDARLSRWFRSLAFAGAGLFLFANLMLFIMQLEFIRYSILQPVTEVAPTPLAPSASSHEAPYQTAADIFRGYNGAVWIARIALTLVVLALLLRLRSSVVKRPWQWRTALGGGLAMLATLSLTAHAAVVPESRFAVVLDWTHLTAMSLWLGGLLPLVLTLREFRRLEGTRMGVRSFDAELRLSVVHRFSTMALIAVIWLAATGLFAAYVHVRNPSLLIPTTYGRVLIAKLLLFAALFALGATHRRVSIPHLKREASPPTPTNQVSAASNNPPQKSFLERLLPVEIGVGVSLLAAVALMLSLGTSASVWPAHQALGLVSESRTGDVSVTLRAIPGKTGENAGALDIADRRLGPPTTADRVTLDLEGQTLVLEPEGNLIPGTVQRFASPDLLDLPEGKTMATYTISRPSYPDATGTILFDMPPAVAGKPSE